MFRPWPADDGALVRLRTPGGRLTRDRLGGLLAAAREYGDGRVHLTRRANLQLRGLPGGEELPDEVVAAIRATGLLPHPGHELVRNILASPLTGLSGGRVDLGPVVAALDDGLCADPALAHLPGRFLFVLDDGRGDLVDRPLDLGLVAVSDVEVQLRLGTATWGPVVPLAEAVDELLTAARDFLAARGTGPDAPWHVDELTDPPVGQARDERTRVSAGPPPFGRVADGVRHLAVPDGVLETADGLPERLVVTPWKSLIAVDR
ncbi:nitrite reductase [Nocardioides rotundus]|nr:nitrite reductase [Nocardioides rotundus]